MSSKNVVASAEDDTIDIDDGTSDTSDTSEGLACECAGSVKAMGDKVCVDKE